MKRVAVIQPNYLPWKGYFDLIQAVDTFIFLDDVQYTQRDWRNRNRIKVANGSSVWLTVPTLGGRSQLISEVQIDSSQGWSRKHLEALRHSYGATPHFTRYWPRIAEILQSGWRLLVDLDVQLTEQIAEWLGLRREFRRSTGLAPSGTKDERLIDLVRKVSGTHYLSGPAARDYIIPERFRDASIHLSYHEYSGYPEYSQISQPFDHFVTILDLLFAVGPDAPDYIWGRLRERDSTLEDR